MKKKWEFISNDANQIKELAEKNNISTLLANIFINKGITEKKDIELFINPTRDDFHDPYEMPDMEKAVNRILKAIDKNEKTIIYGDYDVDGITSITVLKKFFLDRGFEVGTYIPNRLNEGYGLNKEAVKEIADQGYKLIITVDCGISGIEEIEYAYSLGLEVIVTDHHEPLEEIPKAVAVVDCKRKDNKYPFNGLAGVGVSFKLIQALSQKLDLDSKEYLKYLDIVAIGTISDIVPLVDENRVITKLGLKLLEQTRNQGLKQLIKSSGYSSINSTTVSFGIAPRINACGRMGHEQEALKLFLTNNIEESREITDNLNNYNRSRQDIEKKILTEAINLIETKKLEKNNSLVLASENWHHGVIGIVASKITELFFKPTILLNIEGDIAQGSGRSVPGFDLHKALIDSSEYLEKYGGHEMAVGLTLKTDNIDNFEKKFEELAKEAKTEEIIPIIKIDQEINDKDITLENVKSLDLLEPYGEANKMPLFLYRNLKIDSIRALSEGKHIKLTLRDKNTIINAIGFNMGYYTNEFLIGDKIDVVGHLEINKFNNVESVQINLSDIRKSY